MDQKLYTCVIDLIIRYPIEYCLYFLVGIVGSYETGYATKSFECLRACYDASVEISLTQSLPSQGVERLSNLCLSEWVHSPS